jgi:DNA invertase Pin-like site-specific DNA recombinase
MATVYSYLRFSRPEQMKGDSQRRQLAETTAWVKTNGHTLDTSLDLRDLGVSAFRGKNAEEGALADFLEAVELGRVKPGSILAIESFDRLSRQGIDDAHQLFRRILKAGVEIKTFVPGDFFTAADLNNPVKMIVALTVMARAHEESATKSSRLREAWTAKRDKIGQRKLTGRCPEWLCPVRQGGEGRIVRFDPIPERVATVLTIYRMALDGLGYVAIAKALNADQVPTLGRGKSQSKFWSISSVRKVLKNRSVLGEYQPHRLQDSRRVAVGEPIPDYFPAIVGERDFYAVQKHLEERRSQPGRHGKGVANLFTGLVRDARDGSNCRLIDKGDGAQLVSSAALCGKPGAVYLSFPYAPFEQALLVWGYDLPLGDVLPRKATNLEAELAKSEGRVADLTNRITTLRAKMKTADKFESLVDLLVDLEKDKAHAETRVEQIKREMTTSETEALDRTRDLIRKLRSADAEEKHRLRLKLRSILKRLVRSIALLTVKVNNDRLALVDVELTNGTHRRLTIMPGKRVAVPDGLADLDLRDWQHWPKKYRAIRFELQTEEAREMIALESEGLQRNEIADRLGMSVSRVSRTLLRQGSRKRTKKLANDERLMTWHPAGNGWAKTHKGQRFFIGIGKLAQAYPRLVKARTADGSWKAANAWWQANLAELNG